MGKNNYFSPANQKRRARARKVNEHTFTTFTPHIGSWWVVEIDNDIPEIVRVRGATSRLPHTNSTMYVERVGESGRIPICEVLRWHHRVYSDKLRQSRFGLINVSSGADIQHIGTKNLTIEKADGTEVKREVSLFSLSLNGRSGEPSAILVRGESTVPVLDSQYYRKRGFKYGETYKHIEEAEIHVDSMDVIMSIYGGWKLTNNGG